MITNSFFIISNRKSELIKSIFSLFCEFPSELILNHNYCNEFCILYDDRLEPSGDLQGDIKALIPDGWHHVSVNIHVLSTFISKFSVDIDYLDFSRASLRNLALIVFPPNPCSLSSSSYYFFLDGDLIFSSYSFKWILKALPSYSWGYGTSVYLPPVNISRLLQACWLIGSAYGATLRYIKALCLVCVRYHLKLSSLIPPYAPTLASGFMFIEKKLFVSIGGFADLPHHKGWGGEDALLGSKIHARIATAPLLTGRIKSPHISFFYYHPFVNNRARMAIRREIKCKLLIYISNTSDRN